MYELSLTEVLQALNATGVSVILLVFVWMFLKGEILSRRVYEEMTQKVVTEIATRIITEITVLLEEWRNDR